MSDISIYNIKGESIDKMSLPAIFETEPNDQLMAQYVRVYLANQRQGTRDTKDRSEVNGKAKKPYKQKGTGHARHGSLKAPSMKGGGIAHGPKPYDFSLKMSKMMKKGALISALAKQKSSIKVLDSAKMEATKTKDVLNFLLKSESSNKVLFVTKEKQMNLVKSSRNLKNAKVSVVSDINAYMILNCETIVLEKDALSDLPQLKTVK